MYILHFVYPFICLWTLGCFHLLTIVNNAVMNMVVQISFLFFPSYHFIYFFEFLNFILFIFYTAGSYQLSFFGGGLHCCMQDFSSCGEQGLLFVAVCGLLTVVVSPIAEHGPQLRHAGSPVVACGPQRAGSVVVEHRSSCSTACGILPDQGLNPRPLHQQVDSQPLHHQGSPSYLFYTYQCIYVNPNILFYLFIYLILVSAVYLFIFGCTWSLLLRAGGYSSLWCADFSLRCFLPLQSMGSRHSGFSSHSAQAEQLWLMGSIQSAGSVLVVGMWDLPKLGLEPVYPCISRRILNHCATREVPQYFIF